MEKLEEYRWPLLKGLTISLFFLYFFIKGKLLGGSDFYNLLNLTFGVYYYFLIFCPLLTISVAMAGSKRRKSVLRIRLFSAILFFFFCTFLILVNSLNPAEAVGLAAEEEFVKTAWNEMNLGGGATSVMHLLYFNVEREILLKGLTGGAVITGIISFTKIFTDGIRSAVRMKRERRERKILQKKERELQEKISIKEEINKKMNLKKQKNLKQQEEKIQQEVDKFIEGEEPPSPGEARGREIVDSDELPDPAANVKKKAEQGDA